MTTTIVHAEYPVKRLFITAVLTCGVLAIAYYQSQRQESLRQESYAQAKNEGEVLSLRLQASLDSAARQVESIQADMADTLISVQAHFDGVIDSLESETRRKQQSLDSLAKLVRKAQLVSKKPAKSQPTRHQQILTYYKKRFDQLPKDLTSAERDIAISEIREETTGKFAITDEELTSIRAKGNLSY